MVGRATPGTTGAIVAAAVAARGETKTWAKRHTATGKRTKVASSRSPNAASYPKGTLTRASSWWVSGGYELTENPPNQRGSHRENHARR